VFNCLGFIITTNYKTDGIYLPADDRRHYVAWSHRKGAKPGRGDGNFCQCGGSPSGKRFHTADLRHGRRGEEPKARRRGRLPVIPSTSAEGPVSITRWPGFSMRVSSLALFQHRLRFRHAPCDLAFDLADVVR
jgi:hypothetical protein